MNAKLAELKAMALRLGELFPGAHPDISFNPETGFVSVGIHRCGYEIGTEALRGLGFGKRSKTVIDNGNEPFTALNGWDSENHISVTAYVNELPPTCHIKEVTVKVPKKETVDTGEFVEIKQRKVVCSGAEHAEAA